MAAWQQKDESNYKNRHNKSPMKKGSLISIYYTPIHSSRDHYNKIHAKTYKNTNNNNTHNTKIET